MTEIINGTTEKEKRKATKRRNSDFYVSVFPCYLIDEAIFNSQIREIMSFFFQHAGL